MADPGTRAAMAGSPWAMVGSPPPQKKLFGGLLPGGHSGSAEGEMDRTSGGQGELDGTSGGKGERDGTRGGSGGSRIF